MAKKGLENACFGCMVVHNGETLKIGVNRTRTAYFPVSSSPTHRLLIAEDIDS